MPVRSPAPPTISSDQRVPLGGHLLGLADRLADQPAAPQRQPGRRGRVAVDQHADLADRELGVAGVGQRLDDQRPGGLVDVGGDLPVEVGGQAVPDVGLDQRLAPGPRFGPGVEGLDRVDERRHRLLRVGAEFGQPVDQLAVVAHLHRRHLRQRGAQRGARRHPGVGGHPVEGAQLAVGKHAEQVDDGRRIGRLGSGHGRWAPFLGVAATVACAGPPRSTGRPRAQPARRRPRRRPARLDWTLRLSRSVPASASAQPASPSQRVSAALAASSDGPAAGAHDRCACTRKWIPMTDAVLSTNYRPNRPRPTTPVEPAPLAGHAPVKPDSPLFSDFADQARDHPGAGRCRHRAHLRDPGAHAADRAGRLRPDRPGPHRHRQDPRLRGAAAEPAGAARRQGRRSAGAGDRTDPGAGGAGGRRPDHRRPSGWAPGW